jgi:uncharacterized protein YuzE
MLHLIQHWHDYTRSACGQTHAALRLPRIVDVILNNSNTLNTGVHEFQRGVLEYLIDNCCSEDTFAQYVESSRMKVTYDREADALYIRLFEDPYQSRVVRLTDDVSLDFAEGEKLVGIEVLGASRLFPRPEVPEIELADLIPHVVPS